jgi:diguanylate cyclase (GGDEF)-like protein
MVDTARLFDAVRTLTHRATTDFSLPEMLISVCEAAVRCVEGSGAGVMQVDGLKTLFVHASAAHLVPLERLQQTLGSGPCVDAASSGQVVVINDMARDNVWPDYAREAIPAGVLAAVAVPLRARGHVWGVLDFYRDHVSRWRAEELDAMRLLADVAATFIVMNHDRTCALAAQAELAYLAMHDPLTGLPNRTLLLDRAEHALQHARRQDHAVAVLFIDLDDFKSINDQHGHAAGDLVLKAVADRMSGTLRACDTLARLAGDEFVLLCEELPNHDEAHLRRAAPRIAGRLHDSLAAPIPLNTEPGSTVTVTVTVSIGAATSIRGAIDPETLLHHADTAMYRVKSGEKTDA